MAPAERVHGMGVETTLKESQPPQHQSLPKSVPNLEIESSDNLTVDQDSLIRELRQV